MDYVVGSVAALISGNVTPNRPKVIKKALTPMKHQPSPNVTPKSQSVEDRSIFLSPTLQKKKAIVKKSPKRIFQNPDLDVTNEFEGNSSVNSPKADKVKKHLKDNLEAEVATKTCVNHITSPNNKHDKTNESTTLENTSLGNENTPKKKKKKQNSSSNNTNSFTVENVTEIGKVSEVTNDNKNPSKKRKKDQRKSMFDITEVETEDKENVIENEVSQILVKRESDTPKKKKKKSKSEITETEFLQIGNENVEETKESIATIDNNQKTKKKNKKRKKKSKTQTIEQAHMKVNESITNDDEDVETQNEESTSQQKDKDKKSKNKNNVVNPNAITNKDTDSEHESDNEIDSENEQINNEILNTEQAEESSDEEEDQKQKKQVKNTEKEEEVNTEDEIRRTLFVGNVPFSNKCKKEIKKIFSKYGTIETVRIRTVPVKDANMKPKLAVIKNELHPDRTTVNMYIKYKYEYSVEKALAENNTVLNERHLRVTRSDVTGVEHDPRLSVFVGNIPFGLEDDVLRAKFEKCGDVASVRIIRDRKTNAGKGFGYVNFTSKDGVELALNLPEDDLIIKNRVLRIKRCTQLGPKQKQNKHAGRGQGNNFPARNQGRNNYGGNRFGDRNQGGRNFGNRRGWNEGNKLEGARGRIMNKRKHQDAIESGPPKRRQQNADQPPREKKAKKEFVGMTAEKKKKHKFNKGQKKKKALSEILTK